jgi:parvulin-like peptidyl-prolyl isomerase
MVAHHARQFGIRVQVERVEQLADAEVQQIRRELAESGGGTDFGAYVWKVFGMREADWQETRRRRIAKQLYLGYVIRYLALREDRVHIRFLVHKDEQIAREVADKVRAGADFATLALRHSEDPSRRDGGLLPPFGRGFEHPVATAAFTLQSGEVSAPFQARWGDGERWFVVYCLERLPGRDLTFAAVAGEIDNGLVARPVSKLELDEYLLRWRGELQRNAPPPAAGER